MITETVAPGGMGSERMLSPQVCWLEGSTRKSTMVLDVLLISLKTRSSVSLLALWAGMEMTGKAIKLATIRLRHEGFDIYFSSLKILLGM